LINEVVAKYRKGSCKNCGAMTHKEKFCVERPRKRGAAFTGLNFAKDEVIVKPEYTFDIKQDRWNNFEYDSNYVKEFSLSELENRKRKFDELSDKFITEPDADQKKYPAAPVKNEIAYDKKEDDSSDKKDEDGVKKKTIVRNLRIR
jgi:pre-mRNA-processing factor SLU7